jgi:hypothetical protein
MLFSFFAFVLIGSTTPLFRQLGKGWSTLYSHISHREKIDEESGKEVAIIATVCVGERVGAD